MVKIISILFIIGIFIVGLSSAYYCIENEDNYNVQEFKNKINTMAINEDLKKGISQEAINLKIKYFHPCKKW